MRDYEVECRKFRAYLSFGSESFGVGITRTNAKSFYEINKEVKLPNEGHIIFRLGMKRISFSIFYGYAFIGPSDALVASANKQDIKDAPEFGGITKNQPFFLLDFSPGGSDFVPVDFADRRQAIQDGAVDYSAFLNFWKKSWRYRKVKNVVGGTNFHMAKFAVNRLGFRFVQSKEELQGKAPYEIVQIYGEKSDLMENKERVDKLAKRIQERDWEVLF